MRCGSLMQAYLILAFALRYLKLACLTCIVCHSVKLFSQHSRRFRSGNFVISVFAHVKELFDNLSFEVKRNQNGKTAICAVYLTVMKRNIKP